MILFGPLGEYLCSIQCFTCSDDGTVIPFILLSPSLSNNTSNLSQPSIQDLIKPLLELASPRFPVASPLRLSIPLSVSTLLLV